MSTQATTSALENSAPRPIQRLLIVRLSAMGDIIHTLPAVSALRQAFPQATIGWLVEERWAELLCTLPTPHSGPRSRQRPLVDRIHTVNTAKWRKALLSSQTWEQVAAGLSELRSVRYEVAADFQGAVRSALLARWSGAPVIFGLAQPRENAASMFYTRQVMARGTHIVEQNLSLAEAIAGGPLEMPQVELPYDEAVEEECNRRLQGLGVRDFVLLNPGAGWGAKRWPANRYGDVARQLAEDGLQSLINFGPGEEELARQVEAAGAGAAKGISRSLTQLIALTRRARLFIGGDTGPMHLAAALRIPVVAIFGPTNPARNGPFGTRSLVLRNPASPTTHTRHPQPDEGLLEIAPEHVVAAARQLLRSCRG
ncbi:MAG TPA: lipopolysaccharide heptosyltransferase I [Terriglobales bacterium]|jgi:heptosyltransferase-1|nr:lipopolysaccharide heptosyltransferase I [Terriglobales bacterium]